MNATTASLHLVMSLMVVGLFLVAGCGSRTIPLAAVEGTTMTLLIPGNFPTGFGRSLGGDPTQVPAYDPASPLEDPQRGELVFRLATQYPENQFLAWMPVRYITRVDMPDSAPLALEGPDGFYERGQTLVLLDVPEGHVSGDYQDLMIQVLLKKRVPGATSTLTTPIIYDSYGSVWAGWGNYATNGPGTAGSATPGTRTFALSIPVRIYNAAAGQDEEPTPLHGWQDATGVGLTWDDATDPLLVPPIDGTVPYPEFSVVVDSGANPPPAAWEAEISYPREIVRIRGASLRHHSAGNHWDVGEVGPHTASTAMVLLEADEDPEDVVPCGAGSGIFKLRVINPDLKPADVQVAFDLRNFESSDGGGGCARRTVASDFLPLVSFKAYDEDGVDITASVTPTIPTSSFR